ncbi:MAG TPA: PadR family transcriptional regulator [Vicinamibacteria bacterium]
MAETSLLHGTLDALILKTLVAGARHGYGIARHLEDATQGAIDIEEGSLYPALYRLERRGLLEADWRESETGRKAKFYKLTREGRSQLARETKAWAEFSAAISRVLLPA